MRKYIDKLSIFLIIVALCSETRGAVRHGRHVDVSKSKIPDKHWDDVDINEAHRHGFTPAPRTSEPHRDVCEPGAVCVLPVQCPAHVYGSAKDRCTAIGGRKGCCCTTGHNHTETITKKGRGHQPYISDIDPDMLEDVARHSRVNIAEMHMHEARILSTQRSAILPMGSASYGHFRNTKVYSATDLMEVMSVANRAMEIALATRAFKDKQGISNQQLEWSMVQQDLRPTPLGSACAPIIECPMVPERYRRIDGTCNNHFNPTWGAPLTPYSRLLPPSYQDGIWSPRVSENKGQPLRSPREISLALFPDGNYPSNEYTLMLMQYGQFLSHDITHSIDATFANGSAISCCNHDGSKLMPEEMRHYACMPIKISSKDPFYSAFKQRCMNFVRSVMAPRSDCTLGYAQQMNKITHFLDASSVYGSTPDHTAELRSFHNGRLHVFEDFGRELLPLTKQPDACLTQEQGSACFASGDSRTNQMISLVAVHTIFLREHNRLAEELYRINPHWSDERLFLEARRILTAEMQVITYKEFLSTLLGESVMRDFDIGLQMGHEYSYDYNQRIEPSVTNEFATAAFRMGHSMVDGLLKIYGVDKMDEMISIPETMFYPGRMRKHFFYDQILSSLTTEPIQKVDSYLSEALTRYMFRAGNPFGVDLASLNIQRGRDHGLRSYNDYRQLIGLPKYKYFKEFGPEMGPKLESVYDHIDDIDLWVGGLIESKGNNNILGPTFRDIIADQFVRLKKGDRYFFDHDPSVNPGYFTPHQLVQLRKASMSRMVCDNSDGYLLGRQAPNAFRTPGVPGNEFEDCSGPGIPTVDLSHWQEYF